MMAAAGAFCTRATLSWPATCCTAWWSEGRGGSLAQLTSDDLLEHGNVELRSWITVLGAVGDTRPEMLCYEPFYSALMGMGVAYWDLE